MLRQKSQNNWDSSVTIRQRTSLHKMETNSNVMEDKYIQYTVYDTGDEHSDDEDIQDSDITNDHGYGMFTFKNGTDVSAIPIQKDGMAVCEKCGTIGVKHAFYSKEKRFCSMACSRGYMLLQREGKPIPKPQPIFKFPLSKVKIFKKDDVNKSVWTDAPSAAIPEHELANSFTWEPHLTMETFTAVPVSSFKHAPLQDCWDDIMVGMKVEVENRDYGDLTELFPQSYWVASVIKVAGYKAMLRFEGFGFDNSEDFWLNLCNENVHPVGWCASQGKPLIPPKRIQHKHLDWKKFLVKRLTGARTLPVDFHEKVAQCLVSRFQRGIRLEVVDKNRISQTRIAYVDEMIGGRMHIKYSDADDVDGGFWCHEHSPLIHPINWSQSVGHDIVSWNETGKNQTQKSTNKSYDKDATPDMFAVVKNTATSLKFREGMKLETIDPLNLSTVCVATVVKVLKHNYLMIGIDGYNASTESFCHHASSNCIFPAGFCSVNNIELTPPRGYRGEFKWFDYLKATKSVAAPVGLFNRELPHHGIEAGMKLEAVDLMEPRLICVGTVTKVVGRLLRVHFDGWDTTYDQWCDCESPDLYPVGWCEVVGYPLEPPRNYETPIDKKRKSKTAPYRGPRKKKRTRFVNLLKGKGKLGSANQSEDDKSVRSETQQDSLRNDEKRFEMYNYNDDVDIEDDASCEVDLPVNNKQDEDSERVRSSVKTIPRLVDSDCKVISNQTVITPELWSISDVSQFLRINDCGTYCESFNKKKIDGRKFLTLTREQIVNLTGMKVGPSLKIFDLIQQLKAKIQVS